MNTMSTPQGRLFVISGPSGVGKGTMVSQLLACIPKMELSISATTRPPRPGEADGVDYHFLTHEQFEADIARGRFLEHAQYGKDFYGTPKDHIANFRRQGCDVVLEIEVKGAMQVKTQIPDAILIYIQPPSLAALKERLEKRGTETPEKIQMRLTIAEAELQSIRLYDYLITNDDLDTAARALRSIVLAERHRIMN